MAGENTPGGGPSANFGNVTVGNATVGNVTVTRMDQRTGGPQDSGNELVEQVKVLGDRLDTSLKAMLDQLREMRREDISENRTESKSRTKSEKQADESLRGQKRSQANDDKMIDALDKMTKTLAEMNKGGEKNHSDLVDAIHQMGTGVNKELTAGLKSYVTSHTTIMRNIMQGMRDKAHADLSRHQRHNDMHITDRNNRYWARHGHNIISTDPNVADAKLSQSERLRLRMSNMGGSAFTYGRQKFTEVSHHNAEQMATAMDRFVGGLISFDNTMTYANKKWKQFVDVAGSGVDGFAHFMLDDFKRLFTAGLLAKGDALGATFDLIRKSVKAGFDNADSQLYIAGRSLAQASEDVRNTRKGVQRSGFNTDAFMGFEDANETLLDIKTQLKRAGMLDQMSDMQQQRYMAEQLKQAQLTAENTGLTVKEVMKANLENSKKSAAYVAAGMLRPDQKGGVDKFMTRIQAHKPLQDMFNQMIAAGSFEQWMGQDRDRAAAIVASGADKGFKDAYDAMMRGDVEGAMAHLQRAGVDTRSKTQANGQPVSGALMKGDIPGILASLNQVADYKEKNKPGTGSDVMSGVNAIKDFLTNIIPLDSMKAILGLLAGANVLLGGIYANTSGISMLKGGAGLLGGGGRALGGATAAMGGGATAVAGGAAAASRGLLGGLSGIGRGLVSKVPVVGGIIGGGSMLYDLYDSIMNKSGRELIPDSAGGFMDKLMKDTMSNPLGPLGALGKMGTDLLIGGAKSLFGDSSAASPTAPQVSSTAQPQPPTYTAANPDDTIATMSRGMYARMDIQIEKLTQLVDLVKDQNRIGPVGRAMSAPGTVPPPAGDDAGSGILGAVRRLFG